MNTKIGLFGIVGIWATMAMMPLIELLQLSTLAATFLRGASGVLVIGLVALFNPGLITLPDRNTMRIVAFFALATLCIFQAIPIWGSNFTVLFLDMALFVPLFYVLRRGQKVGTSTGVAVLVSIIGTMLTLRVFTGSSPSWEGLLWSMGALLANGLFIEYAGQAKQANWNKAFWMSSGLVVLGSPAFAGEWTGQAITSNWIMLALLFAITTGVLNFYSAFVAFANLSAVSVGVLVLGVTPTIILSSYLMLDKSLGWDQTLGVAITLAAVYVFGQALQEKGE